MSEWLAVVLFVGGLVTLVGGILLVLWVNDEPWAKQTFPNRYLWYPVWFVALLVTACVVGPVALCAKAVQPIERGRT